MSGLSRFDFYPRDWFLDTRDLSNAAKGIYVDLFSAMYARGGPLPYDEQELCGLCGCKTVRSLRPLLRELIEKEKLHVIDDFLVNNRTMEEIAAANKNIEDGKRGGRPPNTTFIENIENLPPVQGEYTLNTAGTHAETEGPFVEKQGLNPNPPSPSPSKEDKYVFQGKIIRLTKRDFTDWQKTYHCIPDLKAALAGIDDWCDRTWAPDDPKRKDWWFAIRNMVNKRHQRAAGEDAKERTARKNRRFVQL